MNTGNIPQPHIVASSTQLSDSSLKAQVDAIYKQCNRLKHLLSTNASDDELTAQEPIYYLAGTHKPEPLRSHLWDRYNQGIAGLKRQLDYPAKAIDYASAAENARRFLNSRLSDGKNEHSLWDLLETRLDALQPAEAAQHQALIEHVKAGLNGLADTLETRAADRSYDGAYRG